MKKIYALSLLACFAGINSFGQAKLLEKVEKKGNEIIIPYEKYVLPNGLTVILHEDHSDPIVHVDVTYHVGSAREEIGKSGFAHAWSSGQNNQITGMNTAQFTIQFTKTGGDPNNMRIPLVGGFGCSNGRCDSLLKRLKLIF